MRPATTQPLRIHVCDHEGSAIDEEALLRTHSPAADRKQTMVDSVVFMLDILDTAGQEEFESLRDQWIMGGDGFVIVFDITSKES